MKKRILVLGCTGSIGTQTLDILSHMSERFTVCGLSAGSNKQKLQELCQKFNCGGTLFSEDGIAGIKKLVETSGADIAVNGIAGSAGLEPSFIVLQNGIDLALANKETVVMAWPIIQKLALLNNAHIIPVDSEHSAVFNLIQKIGNENVSEIIITASGGPFRTFTKEQLASVTVEQALKHPTWNMGRKITIDSATLANKGLEVIEACRLFSRTPDKVKVLVHPQSLIHSLVRTRDGMLYAQISNPDMRHPIFGALVWPEYDSNYLEPFDLANHEMTFYPPRLDDFPLLNAAYECARKDNSYTIAFNAANEIAANSFLEKKCNFPCIASCVQAVLQYDWSARPDDLSAVLEADAKAREIAQSFILSGGSD